MAKFNDLNWRRLINQVSDMDTIKNLVDQGSNFYIGVDPTADSLHLGHYLAFVVARHFNKLGMKPVFVIGGFTAMIGDPSGKNEERPMVDNKEVLNNVKSIKKLIVKLADALEIEDYEIINNLDYYNKMSIVDLFQQYGKLFNVNTMLSRESVKKRIDNGISFTEFSYQMFQSIDFLKLFQEQDVRLQIGGSDQWGNMTSGLELIRKVEGPNQEVGVLTFNLITDDQGQKIGKTQGKPIWLEKKLFNSFDMYQYFFNLKDEEAKRFLAQLTFISEEDFKKVLTQAAENPSARLVQRELARRIISRLHSEKDFIKAVKTSEKAFSNKQSSDDDLSMLPVIKFQEGVRLAEHLISTEHVRSMREYKEFLAQGAIKVDGVAVSDENFIPQNFDNHIVVNIGKKRRVLIKK